MPISREAMTTIEALSVPLERDRREAFINTVVQRVEAAVPNEVGIGFVCGVRPRR